jgi:hypothetical protein
MCGYRLTSGNFADRESGGARQNVRVRYALLFALLAGIAAPPAAHPRTATQGERKACEEKVQRRIDALDSRMRAGYSVEQGEDLRERRRKLEKARADCRYTRR